MYAILKVSPGHPETFKDCPLSPPLNLQSIPFLKWPSSHSVANSFPLCLTRSRALRSITRPWALQGGMVKGHCTRCSASDIRAWEKYTCKQVNLWIIDCVAAMLLLSECNKSKEDGLSPHASSVLHEYYRVMSSIKCPLFFNKSRGWVCVSIFRLSKSFLACICRWMNTFPV